MSRVLIISFSPIRSDPRVMRQIDALGKEHTLTVAGFGQSPSPEIEFHDISAPPASLFGKAFKAAMLISRLYDFYYWRMSYVTRAMAQLKGKEFDFVLANDVNSLPLALALAKGAPVMLDAHEYSPKEFEDLFVWRLFFAGFYSHLCRKYLKLAAAMTTVCQGISEEYRKNFGVASSVVLNCPDALDLPVRPVDPARIRLIHHGVSIRSRKLELMIEMMQRLDSRYTLDLMLVNSNPVYMQELQQMAAGDSRIRFREPVPMRDIPAAINEYDIGVFLLPPVNFNYRFALPNKFFEYMQARLAIAIGPSPEMARIVQTHKLGVVSETFAAEDLAHRIELLTPQDIDQMKRQSDAASRQFNATQAAGVLRAEVGRLLGH